MQNETTTIVILRANGGVQWQRDFWLILTAVVWSWEWFHKVTHDMHFAQYSPGITKVDFFVCMKDNLCVSASRQLFKKWSSCNNVVGSLLIRATGMFIYIIIWDGVVLCTCIAVERQFLTIFTSSYLVKVFWTTSLVSHTFFDLYSATERMSFSPYLA